MANMASVSYAIEGTKNSLENILGAIFLSMNDVKHWTEWATCRKLGFSEEELEGKRLGGEISDEPEIDNKGVLRFWAEERWGLQDFEELLRQKFPGIKVYWQVEESGCDVYCTNDKEGKYFPDRYYADCCVDGIYDSEYFTSEEALFKWLSKLTNREIKSFEDAETFEKEFVDTDAEDDNFIIIHEFEIIE